MTVHSWNPYRLIVLITHTVTRSMVIQSFFLCVQVNPVLVSLAKWIVTWLRILSERIVESWLEENKFHGTWWLMAIACSSRDVHGKISAVRSPGRRGGGCGAWAPCQSSASGPLRASPAALSPPGPARQPYPCDVSSHRLAGHP